MANKVITAASVLFSTQAQMVDGIAGEAMSIMQPVYLDTTVVPNVFRLADANLSLVASRVFGVVASPAAAANQPIRVCWKDPDCKGGLDALIVGETLILSATAGAIAPVADLVAGMYNCVLGVGNSLTNFALYCGVFNSTAPKA